MTTLFNTRTTALNVSGIFSINTKETVDGNMTSRQLNSSRIESSKTMKNQTIQSNQTSANMISNISTNMENHTEMSGQILSIVNGLITITNSTGIFVGNSMDSLRKVDKPQDMLSSLNTLAADQSSIITNGLVTISNSSGIFVGSTVNSLTKVQ